MTYAIAVGFDVESTEKMRRKIVEIAESNINPYMVSNKVPPHLTISLFETDNEVELHKVLEDVRLKISRKRIRINSVEMFEPRVIYYAPDKADFLVELNEATTNKLFEIGIKPDKYYLPDNWVPHIALGVQLTLDELKMALEIVKKDFIPFDSIIQKVVLAKCNPYKEIVEYTI